MGNPKGDPRECVVVCQRLRCGCERFGNDSSWFIAGVIAMVVVAIGIVMTPINLVLLFMTLCARLIRVSKVIKYSEN